MNHSENTFENKLQQRFENYTVDPSVGLDANIASHISNSGTSKLTLFKWPLLLGVLTTAVIVLIMSTSGLVDAEIKDIPPVKENHIEMKELLAMLVKDDPEINVPKDKLLLLNVYMENCVFCERMEQVTCEDPDVKELLEKRFLSDKHGLERP